ncbi:major facilitator superfamily domain-containing protein [Daedaleopsis nitida]|nr:major facilitator superfamily domain-containing protein [Daedaleopsis nitida]
MNHTTTAEQLSRRGGGSHHSLPSLEGGAIELTDIGNLKAVTATHLSDVEAAPAPRGPSPTSRQSNHGSESGAAGTETADPAREAEYRRKSLHHFVVLCVCLFLNGWHDGTTGPMLPRVQEIYHIGFAVVSLLFVCSAVGYLAGAVATVYMTDRFGFGKILLMGARIQTGAYAALVPAGPFPVMCAAYGVIGFTLSIQAAQSTGFVSSLKKNSGEKVGVLHASYGLGALISPLVATELAKDPRHWSFHYIISAGLYLMYAALLWASFRGKRQEEIMAEEGEFPEIDDGSANKFKQMMRLKEVHLMSFFTLIYVGVEVTLGGWIVTFVLEKRGGGANAGYISSGFFGAGLMLGRIVLLWLNRKIGERVALTIYAILTIGLEITVWFIPSLIQNAIAISLVGLLLGPMFPIIVNQSKTILPRWLLTGSVGYIAGAGQAGSAILPFFTGILAQKFGIASLQPFVVSMMSTLIVLWAVVPRARYVPT